jgi:hypothetical protein
VDSNPEVNKEAVELRRYLGEGREKYCAGDKHTAMTEYDKALKMISKHTLKVRKCSF